MTLLHKAVYYRSIELIKIVLDYKANVNSLCSEGETPLRFAKMLYSNDPEVYSEIIDLLKSHGGYWVILIQNLDI